jgi:hypothetical protein
VLALLEKSMYPINPTKTFLPIIYAIIISSGHLRLFNQHKLLYRGKVSRIHLVEINPACKILCIK